MEKGAFKKDVFSGLLISLRDIWLSSTLLLTSSSTAWYQPSYITLIFCHHIRGGICPCRQCRRQCKIFASGVNFSIFTHLLCFFLLKLLKLGEIDGVKFLARKSGSVNFWTNSMSASSHRKTKKTDLSNIVF